MMWMKYGDGVLLLPRLPLLCCIIHNNIHNKSESFFLLIPRATIIITITIIIHICAGRRETKDEAADSQSVLQAAKNISRVRDLKRKKVSISSLLNGI